MREFVRQMLTIVLCGLLMNGIAFANTQVEEESNHNSETEEQFVPGEFIIEHIGDSYEWHITTFGHTHVSIPLPIILIDGGHVEVFMSSKFHHGEATYKNYRIAKEGSKKGKIERINDDGSFFLDLSITKLAFGVFINIALILCIFIAGAKACKKRAGLAPKGLQTVVEFGVLYVRDDIVEPTLGKKRTEKYLPYLLTLFFFIFFSNIMGLLPIFPGGANLTGNIAVTATLAIFTFFITTLSGNKHYWKDIFNTPGVPWWLKFPLPIMPAIEFFGMFTKPFVLMVRLFANITGGHIIIMSFIALIFILGQLSPVAGYAISPLSIIFYLFMTVVELIVAYVQAYVFTLLTTLYFSMATEEHHEHEAEKEEKQLSV